MEFVEVVTFYGWPIEYFVRTCASKNSFFACAGILRSQRVLFQNDTLLSPYACVIYWNLSIRGNPKLLIVPTISPDQSIDIGAASPQTTSHFPGSFMWKMFPHKSHSQSIVLPVVSMRSTEYNTANLHKQNIDDKFLSSYSHNFDYGNRIHSHLCFFMQSFQNIYNYEKLR